MYIKPWIRDIVRIGGMQGRRDFLRLDMNENPGGLPAWFVEEVKQELTPEYLATYPEESHMLQALAAFLTREIGTELDEDQLCLTNGSDMGIRYLFEVFAKPGSTVVTVSPSFEMYRIYSLVMGLNHRPVMYHEDFTLPVEEILEAIREDTDLVVLLNPNNPIGRAFTEEEFRLIVRKAEAVDALVIVDEAYHYFYQPTFMEEALKEPHVAVLRTFSKVMSVAGVRLGFIAANPQLIRYVKNVRPTFEVNSVALKFGEHLLQHPSLIEDLRRESEDGKAYLEKELKSRGYEVMTGEGNFLFVRPKHHTPQEMAARMETEKHILVKCYNAPLLKAYIRISTGGRPYMEQFLQAFDEMEGL